MGNLVSNSVCVPPPLTAVTFTLNGRVVTVDNASPLISLNDWLRSQPGLTGTKKMCGEGGCGVCVVAVTITNPATDREISLAINSCLCPIYSVHGWSVTTVEGIGSSQSGFHVIQSRIAEHNGSQCGYCTPGFVMSMYSLLQSNPKPTEQDIENTFDGNICRCTGYRPILDGMKSFAVDHEKQHCPDVEDLGPRVCPVSGGVCSPDLCRGFKRINSDPQWFRPSSLSQLVAVARGNPDSRIRLIAGDTGRGVFKDEPQGDVCVDLRGIPELYKTAVTDCGMTVGACVTISALADILEDNVTNSSTFHNVAQHLLKIASVPVRNAGTWAGNLMLAHDHTHFPSDVFIVLAGVGATLTIGHLSTVSTSQLTLWEFLETDMSQSIILSMSLPFATSDTVFKSFKIMPRAVNAHAHVNAAFSLEVDKSCVVKDTPRLVYGGLQERPIAMHKVSDFLVGKSLLGPDTLKGALTLLSQELVVHSNPPAAAEEYKKTLAVNLLYKFYLSVLPEPLPPSLLSTVAPPPRPLVKGQQVYGTTPSSYPVTQPMTKLSAKLQASGEAQYISDMLPQANELAAAFVITTQGNAKIISVDSAKAKLMPGFVKLLTSADIPGENNFMSDRDVDLPEEVFAESVSLYAGQAVGLVLADTQQHADQIAQAVTVSYESLEKPILTVEDAVEQKSFFSSPGKSVKKVGDPQGALSGADHVISGRVTCGSQYHFHMETQTALVIPQEDGYTVYSASQWVDRVQSAIASVLAVPASSVDVSVKRIGGSYGAKITRSNLIAAACALGASVTRRPVRMHMDMDTNMRLIGKRYPYLATYKIGCSKEGKVQVIDVEIFADCGSYPSDNSISAVVAHIDNAYHVPNWLITTHACRTNTPANTFCRSPGTVPGIYIMEAMMEHVANSLGLDVDVFKAANLYQQGQVTPVGMELKYCNISTLWEQLHQTADVTQRKIQVSEYNKANRWRKRGLSMMPLRYGVHWMDASPYYVTVNVYAEDGTVAIAHGGVEIGQGINTKVAQVASKVLGVPLELIKIKPTDTMLNPNGAWTGGSITSELNCLGTINACKTLNDRLDTVRDQIPGLPWKDLIQMASSAGVDMSAKAFVSEKTDHEFAYNCYGCVVTEVEVDTLTGETRVLRADILYDCGDSINPDIDIGQVEGAFVMGLGYWLTEKIIYDKESGELLTHNTWEYKPPSCKDIPIDFRVELLKDAPNPIGVLGSKSVGEPPQCLSCSVLTAVNKAVASARQDAGVNTSFFLSGPATVEDVQQACMVSPENFTME